MVDLTLNKGMVYDGIRNPAFGTESGVSLLADTDKIYQVY
jgi:hypothetical protein